ncbi:efflux transporter outer membrane subunit [Variovorax sp. HJSM1_2]|uniref:efflux transporter outer membrane subunit n=1 Tax=Variovorax sp. HJSM1_2 TaxID=3366263 RepID=UPI003BDCB3E7
MSKLSILSLAAAAFLSGCSMIPTYERPAAPVAGQWPAEAAGMTVAAPGKAPTEVPWQSFFTDPQLQRLIETALQNNRDLRVAVLNIEQARAQFQIKRADQFPTVNLGASGQKVTSSNSATYSVGLVTSSWELDFFGRVASLKEAALAQYLATEEARKSAQISLIASVAGGYIALLADRELLDLTEQTVNSRIESEKLAKLRFDNGVASELDLRQAQSLTETARAERARLTRLTAQDRNALSLLVGQPLGALGELSANASLGNTQLVNTLPPGLPSDVLLSRPDIRQAEQVMLANNANIGAARAAFFPNISLTVGAGTASSHFNDLFSGGTWGFTVAPQLMLPIFDAGRNQANLDSANAGRAIAQAQYEKAIQTAFREVADALAGQATFNEQLRALRAQVAADEATYKLSDLRYKGGVASYLDLQVALRTLFTSQLAAVQTQQSQLLNQVELYKALGGGWTEPPPAPQAKSVAENPAS